MISGPFPDSLRLGLRLDTGSRWHNDELWKIKQLLLRSLKYHQTLVSQRCPTGTLYNLYNTANFFGILSGFIELYRNWVRGMFVWKLNVPESNSAAHGKAKGPGGVFLSCLCRWAFSRGLLIDPSPSRSRQMFMVAPPILIILKYFVKCMPVLQ